MTSLILYFSWLEFLRILNTNEVKFLMLSAPNYSILYALDLRESDVSRLKKSKRHQEITDELIYL